MAVSLAEGRVGRLLFFRVREGADLLAAIKEAAEGAGVHSGLLACIGALRKARLGFYLGEGRYKTIELDGALEIASCLGNLSEGPEGELVVHAHITVCDSEGRAFGGHVLEGCVVSPTAELALLELSGARLVRRLDAATGLKLLAPAEASGSKAA